MSRLPPPKTFSSSGQSLKRSSEDALELADHNDGPRSKKIIKSSHLALPVSNVKPSAAKLTQPKAFHFGGVLSNETKVGPSSESSTTKRTVSGPTRIKAPIASNPKGEPKKLASSTFSRRPQPQTVDPREDAFSQIQNRLVSIEEARQRDHDEMKALMEKEQTKRWELEAESNRAALTSKLSLEGTVEELETTRRQWRDQVMDLEMEIHRKERVIRQLEDELQHAQQDLVGVRSTNDTLMCEKRMQDEELLDRRVRQEVLTTKLTAAQLELLSLQTRLGEKEDKLTSMEVLVTSLEAQKATLEECLAEERRRLSHEKARALESLQTHLEMRQADLKTEQEAEIDALKLKLNTMEKGMRHLRNEIMESRGCIRVVARIRPLLKTEGGPAMFSFPDSESSKREVVLTIPDSEDGMGRRGGQWRFNFDRVFMPCVTSPMESQREVFEELEALVTSVVDGWNCCVFAYGVTGSGKSYTMEGSSGGAGPEGDLRGLIPRAVEHLFREIQTREDVGGWMYTVEGTFVEIYNESIHDLLEGSSFDSSGNTHKVHDIKHDAKTGETRVTDIVYVTLDCEAQVRTLLQTAAMRRTTASTLVNERSSRSHSVFMLKVKGRCQRTGESTTSCLNLVDLAGSERVNVSGTGDDKDRLRETQNINKSLSALGDVIAALGERGSAGEKEREKVHVPYRNSKLTYLLQNSLGGNSKTLMVLNISPLAVHANESLTSLRFATKVNNTTVAGVTRCVSGGRK